MAVTGRAPYVVDAIRQAVLCALFKSPDGMQNTTLIDIVCRLGSPYGAVMVTVHGMVMDGEINVVSIAYVSRMAERAYTDTYGYVLSAHSWLKLARKEQDGG